MDGGEKKWLQVTKGTFEIDVKVSNTHDHAMYHLVRTEHLGIHVFSPKHRWYKGEDNMWHQNSKLPSRHG